MRKLIPTFALLAACALSFGQAPKPKTTIKCAVMPNMNVNIAAATKNKMFADYKGRRYFFCCPACPGMFKKNPAKYAKNPSLPVPKKKP